MAPSASFDSQPAGELLSTSESAGKALGLVGLVGLVGRQGLEP
jgi:hypothetical protein